MFIGIAALQKASRLRNLQNMKIHKLLITLSLISLASILTACVGEIGIASSWPGVTIHEETAYVAYNRHVYAIQLDNGVQRWRFPAEPDNRGPFYASPTLTPDGQLLVGGYNNVLYSLNPDTAGVNWEFDLAQNRYIASPLANEKGIFAPDADRNIYALDFDGNLKWQFTSSGPTWAQPVEDETCQCLYLPSMDHHIYALDPETGALRWQTEPLGGAIVGTPAINQDGVLYTGTFGRQLIALSKDSGEVIWRVDVEGWVWSGPALAGDRLYFGDLSGNFYAVNATNGSILWQLSPQQLDGPIVGTPLVLEETIYFNTDSGTIYAVSTQGAIRWSQIIGGSLYTSPVAAGDKILVAPIRTEPVLIALSRDGAILWRFVPAN